MKTQLGSCSTIERAGLFLLIIAIVAAPAAAQTRTFTVKNNCSETVWAAASATQGPLVFNGTSPGGIELLPGATATATVAIPWSAGRIWGRRNCTFDSSGKGSCATGDCGGVLNCAHSGAGNTTLTEWTLDGGTIPDNYDVSIVDAFDFPISIQLDDPNPNHCVNSACSADLRSFCTGDQRTLDSAGNVVGCKSLFGKYLTPNYGCTGLYGVPASCNNVSWNTNWRGTVVKKHCPSSYGYPYDDPSSDIACLPAPATGYIVTFCPASTVPNGDPTVSPSFLITASNDGQTVTPGNSVTYNLNLAASSTFTGTVALSLNDAPSSCTWSGTGGKYSSSCHVASTAMFSTPSVSLTPNAVVPVTLTIHANTSPAPSLQTSGIEVMGRSGAYQNVWEGQITVADPTAPDYTLQVTPTAPQTIAPGSSITYNLTLTPVNAFSGTVSLASFGGVPGTATFNPATVTLSGSGSQMATLTLATPSTATKKTYYPLISTFTANRLHDFQIGLTLSTGGTPDFTIAATPSSQSVVAGNSTTYTVSVSPQNGFTGSVSLGASGLPSGAGASFNPAAISGSGTSIATITTSSTTPAGNYTLTITGTSGSLSHPANVTLTVTGSVQPPQPPSNLMANAVSNSAINLSWTASPTSGVTYDVFRSTTSGFSPSSSNQIASGVTVTSFSDSGLTCNTAYFYLVEAANSGGTSTPSNQASATTQACVTSVQINAGGPAVRPFAADTDFTGGSTINHPNTIDLSGVTNPAPMAVYQTARVGTFTYTIPGFTAGSSHTVRLHFAETFWGTAGSRIFNVTINGTPVLTNFDIFAAAGAKNKAVIKQFTVNANSSNQYSITFTTVKDKSLVSGVEVQ
jgi:hypothetical protein